jgi:hypothetical protein
MASRVGALREVVPRAPLIATNTLSLAFAETAGMPRPGILVRAVLGIAQQANPRPETVNEVTCAVPSFEEPSSLPRLAASVGIMPLGGAEMQGLG